MDRNLHGRQEQIEATGLRAGQTREETRGGAMGMRTRDETKALCQDGGEMGTKGKRPGHGRLYTINIS
jgi:hypothetical protein